MKITWFPTNKATVPTDVDLTWEQFGEALKAATSTACTLATCMRAQCEHKAGHAWSPASYPVGATRSRASVTEVACLPLDLDHVPPDQMLSTLGKLSPFKRIVQSSHSDAPSDRCLRPILALTRPVLASEYPRFWNAAVVALGVPVDRATSDASRLYYLPSRPSDACHSADDGSGYMFSFSDGALLDVDAILASAPPEPEPVPYDHEFEVPDFAGAPSYDKLGEAAQVLGAKWPAANRHEAQRALSGALARAGWPVELIAEFCATVADIQQPGNADYHKRLSAARSSVEKAHAGMAVQGWTTLEQHVGEEAVNAATVLLGLRSAAPIRDDAFQEWVEAQAKSSPSSLPTPTSGKVTSDLETVVKERTTDKKKSYDIKLIKRVLKGEFIADRVTLVESAVAVVRNVPEGTTVQQIVDVMIARTSGALSGDLPSVIQRAMGIVQEERRAPEPDDEDFKIDMKSGKPLMTGKNVKIALQKMNVHLAYDLLAERKITDQNGKPEIIQDHHLDRLYFAAEDTHNFRPEFALFKQAVSDLARYNSFHPVRDYLDALPEHDGESRIDTWLIRLGGAKDTPFVRAASRLMLVAAVRRIREPGCKFDEMLVLESPVQGTTKTSFVRALCPNPAWFGPRIPLHVNGNTQKQMEATAGKWIIEAGELGGLSKADHDTLKNYMSTQVDESRMAYGHEVKVVPRHFIVIGTTNGKHYLSDISGNRRYWPVEIIRCDIAGLLSELEQLWAEASLVERAGESIRLSEDLWAEAAVEQEARRALDPFEISLSGALDGVEGILLTEDAWRICNISEKKTQSESNRVSQIMFKMGWIHTRRRLRKSLKYCYVSANAAPGQWIKIKPGASAGEWTISYEAGAAALGTN